jgi:hypothetical protein
MNYLLLNLTSKRDDPSVWKKTYISYARQIYRPHSLSGEELEKLLGQYGNNPQIKMVDSPSFHMPILIIVQQIVLGHGGVGKTSLLHRLVSNVFYEGMYL